MPAGASEDFLFCAVEIDSLLLLLLTPIQPTCSTFKNVHGLRGEDLEWLTGA